MRPAIISNFTSPQHTLRAIVLAACLLPVSAAYADAFGSGQSGELGKRVEQLEQALQELKAAAPTPGAVPGASPVASPGELTLPEPPEAVLLEEFSKPEGYEVLAVINGLTLVRDGERRLLLSAEAFERFEQAQKAKAKAAQAEAGGSAGAPPAPPPLNVLSAAQAEVQKTLDAAAPRPVVRKKSTK